MGPQSMHPFFRGLGRMRFKTSGVKMGRQHGNFEFQGSEMRLEIGGRYKVTPRASRAERLGLGAPDIRDRNGDCKKISGDL